MLTLALKLTQQFPITSDICTNSSSAYASFKNKSQQFHNHGISYMVIGWLILKGML